jgi:peptidylprolyl isomerase
MHAARPQPLRTSLTALALALALATTACGGDTAETAGSAETAGVVVEGEVGESPTITVPDGDPPTELVVHDLVEGDGEEVPEGAVITVHYAGVSWLNGGEEFDASFGGEPATFPLDGVIAGWTQGLPGMQVGGRRLLVIPPELGYGDAPPPGAAIQPGDTLVFVIDALEVQ